MSRDRDLLRDFAGLDTLRVARRLQPTGPHAVDGPYAEQFWLPVIGPSALWMLRRFDAGLRVAPDGYDVALPELAASLGLGQGTSTNSPVVRTLARLVAFHIVERHGGAVFVPTAIAPISLRNLARLPERLAALHNQQAA